MKKLIFLPILIFLVFAVVLYGLIPPFFRVRSLGGVVNKQTLALEQMKSYFTNLQAISEQLSQSQEILTNIERALPEEVSVPSLMNFFQITAAESGLLLRNFGYEESADQSGQVSQAAADQGVQVSQAAAGQPAVALNSKIKSVVFQLTVDGNLSSFLSFIKNLEVSSRLLEVNSISFQAGDEKGTQFNIAVKAYSY